MQRTSGFRNRQRQGPATLNPEDNASATQSEEPHTPTSNDELAEPRDHVVQPTAWDLFCQLLGRFVTHNLLFPPTEGPPSARWQAEYDKVKITKLEDRVPGIPRLASLQDSNDGFCIHRRYGDIVARILINKQIAIEQVRTRLHELDEKDMEDPDLRYRLKSIVHHDNCNPEQQALLEELEEKINKYYDLLLKYNQVKGLGEVNPRHHRSIHNYVTKNRAIRRGEEQYLYRIDDFIAVRGRSETRAQRGRRAQDVVEDFVARRPGTWLHAWLKGDEGRSKNKDPLVHYFSETRLAILTNAGIAIMVVGVLLVPVFVLFLADGMTRGGKACVVGVFVSFCMVTVSVAIDLTPENLFMGMATYSAVLVALLSNLTEK